MKPTDEAVPDYWPPVCAPRRRWRLLAVWRPVRAVWRRLPRLAKISLSTALVGLGVLVVAPAVILHSEQTPSGPDGSGPASHDTFTMQVVASPLGGDVLVAEGAPIVGALAPSYSPPVPVRVLPPAAPGDGAFPPGVYANGSRRLGVVSFGRGRTTGTTTFTPAYPDLRLTSTGGCDTVPTGTTLSIVVTVNGNTVENQRCTAGSGEATATAVSADDPHADFSAVSVVPGTASTLTVRVQVSPAGRPVPAGSFTFVEQVPVADYPVPAQTGPVSLPSPGSNPLVVDSRTAGVNGSWLVKADVGEVLEVRTAAPGEVVISCHGTTLLTDRNYDWLPRTEAVRIGASGASTGCLTVGRAGLAVSASDFPAAGWFVESAQNTDPPRVDATDEICTESCTPSTVVSYPSVAPRPSQIP